MVDDRIVQLPPELECLRCGHQWTPRKRLVGVCPKCHTPYWNIPREIKGVKCEPVVAHDGNIYITAKDFEDGE